MRIETKYSIGDKVWTGNAVNTTKQHKCPACQGTGKLEAKALIESTGEEITVLTKCKYKEDVGYGQFSYCYDGLITTWEYEPKVEQYTIGSVRFNSADISHTHSYMCKETGVGSGQVYAEDDLYETEKEARQAANKKVKRATEQHDKWLRETYEND